MTTLLEDPRIRQRWNRISQNAESATESAAANIWTFQHEYLHPCFTGIRSSFEHCIGLCFPDREERIRRRTRGRAEASFDFYDDWDQDDSAKSQGLLGGWGNDELDRLLAGSGSYSSDNINQPPKRNRGMSYGTRGRRTSLDPDPTVIPSTSAIGFLGRLPFKLGGTLRYKPSAADLQDHPGKLRAAAFKSQEEVGSLLQDNDSQRGQNKSKGKGNVRNRSSTVSSGETSDSFRSRGDLFPSDGEDDAVPLDDEFAMALERRMTGSAMNDISSGKIRSSKGRNSSGSRAVSINISITSQSSSHSKNSLQGRRTSPDASRAETPEPLSPAIVSTSLTELRREEERVREEEEMELEMKRKAATKLAVERGLHASDRFETKSDTNHAENILQHILPQTDVQNKATDTVRKRETEWSAPRGPTLLKADAPPQEAPRHAFVPARLPHFS